MRLTDEFYSIRATEAAPLLLGKILCRRLPDGTVLRAKIAETECYFGEEDTACHAHRGRTKRTEILYGSGGAAYIYLCYGIHNLLNVVTGDIGFPQAVLIRSLEGLRGPGVLTREMRIDRSLNGERFADSENLWIEDDGAQAPLYTTTPRIGIDYASDEYRKIEWRFVVK